ncbi:MAG: DUF2272 domain-containing protein [Pseudomonadota bacterium]
MPSSSDFRQRVVEVAVAEWRYWGRQNGYPKFRRGHREHERIYRRRVITYWREGVGRKVTSSRVAWSGAFVSFVMRRAGAGPSFPYSGSHGTYMRAALATATKGRTRGSIVAHRPDQYAPRPGDLVCNTRRRGASFDYVPSPFIGHCDIVIATGRGRVVVIGGNLSNGVSRRTLIADRRGRILRRQPRAMDPSVKGWIMVIEVKI